MKASTYYATYIAKGRTVQNILEEYVKKYGVPPQLIEVIVNTDNPPVLHPIGDDSLPDGLKIVVSRERIVLPDHVFVELFEWNGELDE